MKKKMSLTALLTILIMVFALNFNVSAASSKTVAKIGSKSYTSLQKAISSVKSGQTIKLQKNVSLLNSTDPTLSLKKNTKYTLNLNNKTITCSYCDISKGTVTIKNGKLKAGGISTKNSAKVTLQNVQLKTPSNYSSTRVTSYSKSKLTFKNSKMTSARIETRDKSSLSISGGTYKSVWNYSTGSITINNGTFSQIYNASKGKTTIKNASINAGTNDNSYRIGVSSGSMTIQNINYKAGCAGIIVEAKATLKITGGNFTTKTTQGGTLILNRGKVSITGGKFTRKNTSDFYKDEGIWNSGSISIGPSAALINCKVVTAS